MASKKLKFKFTYPGTNFAPEFIEKPGDLEFTIEGNEQLEGMAEPIEEAVMPEIKDQEDNSPQISAVFNKPPPCGCISFKIDEKQGAITMLLDKMKVTKVDRGIWQADIEIKDDAGSGNVEEQINKYAFNVTIDYIIADKIMFQFVNTSAQKEAIVEEEIVTEVLEAGIPPTINTERSASIESSDSVINLWDQYQNDVFLREYPNPGLETEVILNLVNITMDGQIFIEFNQELIVPPFTPWKTQPVVVAKKSSGIYEWED